MQAILHIGLYLCVRYEEILLQQDPLPAYGLKLLLVLLEQHPAFIRSLNTYLLSILSTRDCSYLSCVANSRGAPIMLIGAK